MKKEQKIKILNVCTLMTPPVGIIATIYGLYKFQTDIFFLVTIIALLIENLTYNKLIKK